MNRLTLPLLAISLLAAPAARAQFIAQEGTVIPMPGGAFPHPPIPAPLPSPRLPGSPLPLPMPMPGPMLAAVAAMSLPQSALAVRALPELAVADVRTLRSPRAASADVARSLQSVRGAFALEAETSAPQRAELAAAEFDGAAQPAKPEPVRVVKRTEPPSAPRPPRPQRLPEHDLERDLGIRL